MLAQFQDRFSRVHREFNGSTPVPTKVSKELSSKQQANNLTIKSADIIRPEFLSMQHGEPCLQSGTGIMFGYLE